MEIQIEEMRYARKRIEELLALHTGKPMADVAADIERDYIVRGSDAVDYGLVDEIIEHRRQLNVTPGFRPTTAADNTTEQATELDTEQE